MGTASPKQYLTLGPYPIILHSFNTLLYSAIITELVVVCEPAYRHLFDIGSKKVIFAEAGAERQQSVLNGLHALGDSNKIVFVHDGARPFLKEAHLRTLASAVKDMGGVGLGLPVKGTVKRCSEEGMILRTVDRQKLWEMQTPQLACAERLRAGLEQAEMEGISLTDDLSVMEYLHEPTRVIQGDEQLFKITTPHDYLMAQALWAYQDEESKKACQSLHASTV